LNNAGAAGSETAVSDKAVPLPRFTNGKRFSVPSESVSDDTADKSTDLPADISGVILSAGQGKNTAR
jgi:hypothetical protein